MRAVTAAAHGHQKGNASKLACLLGRYFDGAIALEGVEGGVRGKRGLVRRRARVTNKDR